MEEVFPDEDVSKFLFEKGDIGIFAKEMKEKEI